MFKRFLLILLVFTLGLSGTACKKNKPAPSDAVATPSPRPDIKDVNGSYVQLSDYRDYTFMWLENSWRSYTNKNACIQTGHYGLYIDTIHGKIKNMGAIANPVSETQAFAQDSSTVTALPACDMDYTATIDGVEYAYNNGVKAPQGHGTPSRVIESGHTLQSMDLMYLTFKKNPSLKGRLEIKALPAQFSLYYSLYSEEQVTGAGLSFSITLDPKYTKSTVAADGKSITVNSDQGDGITFILPDREGMKLEQNGSTIKFIFSNVTLEADTFTGFGVVCIPSLNASQNDAECYRAGSTLNAAATEISPRDNKEHSAVFDNDRGIWVMDVSEMNRNNGAAFASEKARTLYDRLVFTLKNSSDKTVKVPVMFENAKDKGYGRGMTPLLRDANTLEPIGIPVQINRNWHSYDPSPDNYLSGFWMHAYTLIEVPAGSEVTYEFTMAYMQWGTAYAVSHSQLCLAGWIGSNEYQFWDTSSIGNPGESFCYNIDGCCGFGHICDSNTMGVIQDNGQKYNGLYGSAGGNFLLYKNQRREDVYLTQCKTYYKKQGPNLTDIYYSALTKDGAIKMDINVSMGRTDDATRALHSFKYTFLKDTSFSRLAFYMMGYDTYNSGGWETMTIGNNDGPISFDLAGKTYGTDFKIDESLPVDYIGQNGMQRIEVPGSGFWAAFTGATGKTYSEAQYMQSPQLGNRMLALREYKAVINGQEYSQPSFNLRVSQTTFAPDYKSYLVELCPPAQAGDTIKAGSVVEGTVEYLNLPYKKSNYYMGSKAIENIPEEYFNNYQLAYYYWQHMNYSVTASVGTVIDQLPIKVRADKNATAPGSIAAEITIKGGMSYVPVTFSGVPHYTGYHLEYNNNGTWEQVDQSVKGNDYWQCYYDADTASFELTFNVDHNKPEAGAEYQYRLVKS